MDSVNQAVIVSSNDLTPVSVKPLLAYCPSPTEMGEYRDELVRSAVWSCVRLSVRRILWFPRIFGKTLTGVISNLVNTYIIYIIVLSRPD